MHRDAKECQEEQPPVHGCMLRKTHPCAQDCQRAQASVHRNAKDSMPLCTDLQGERAPVHRYAKASMPLCTGMQRQAGPCAQQCKGEQASVHRNAKIIKISVHRCKNHTKYLCTEAKSHFRSVHSTDMECASVHSTQLFFCICAQQYCAVHGTNSFFQTRARH